MQWCVQKVIKLEQIINKQHPKGFEAKLAKESHGEDQLRPLNLGKKTHYQMLSTLILGVAQEAWELRVSRIMVGKSL